MSEQRFEIQRREGYKTVSEWTDDTAVAWAAEKDDSIFKVIDHQHLRARAKTIKQLFGVTV